MANARIFKVHERGSYRIVDIEASVVTWGGAAGGPPQRARLVLAPRNAEAPALTGDLAGATLIRTPVRRIAVNDQSHEAAVRALGVADRLVAVGGHASYDNAIRARVRAREIHQVGYGWHQPPTLDALVAARPDVFIARMADLTHTQHMDRVRALGIPVVPTFIDAEPNYMGRTDWVRLVGMLVGREAQAVAFVAEVESEVARLKALSAALPRRSMLWAWYQGSGDRWAVTQRNGDGALIRDANAELVLGAPDDPELDTFSRLSTEQLLEGATNADCWMIRDPLSSVYTDQNVLSRFKAYRENNVFWTHGAKNPNSDSWELWEMGMIRPDWLFGDIVKMVHPPLRDGTWRYVRPETWEAGDGAGHH
ncbi:MAG: ABC transporter substrate-binding protein [Hyphomonadaceae bacterium JAD_PAG50586_4]|nr:MAG: ABC transporter substrate-binding protein [Hyphomonadaceae bacterium JAD_PAG50586_4]